MALKDAAKDAAGDNVKGAFFTAVGAVVIYLAIRAYEKAKGSK